MPFGKFKGRPLYSLPTSYLDWLLTLPLRYGLDKAVNAELLTRRDWFDIQDERAAHQDFVPSESRSRSHGKNESFRAER
jgi:hypothetical protein